ncbi:MAG: filamentous hemagglutinin N-terminal domain-containing protein [Symploca sp. SIO3C6]|nr:filamentous hemagglutinin N-terminal domain-containing protein [Symploca sp. SIO3C6]
MVLKLQNSLTINGTIPLIAWLAIASWSNRVLAQITPDTSLGNENSVVTPNVDVKGELADLIEGGAIRDINLFHSFLEFNVENGGRVYFANPAGIESIFTRVTGNNVSNILGTLGVDGAASLFLLNPNGIVFGNNAQLDVEGSFFGTTANSLVFGDGSEFSATNPNQPPLLKVSTPLGLQYGANSTGAIANSGNLAVGQDLTLAGNNLDLQGQLYAGGDLKLQAQKAVEISDSVAQQFIAAAGGELEIQGNESVEIFALNHPDSGLFAGGNLLLRSANSIGGDAHYWSGGSFRIEKLDGSLGSLFSTHDPIARSLGNVELLEYTGSSLHILAGGSVSIPGTVEITQADETGNTINPTDTPTLAQVTLSNGSALVIDGTEQPTLDIRAGMNQQAIGNPLNLTGGNFESVEGSIDTLPESADINVGQISLKAPEGLVFLTNQYESNQSLQGGAIEVETIRADDTFGEFIGNSGSVIIDSRDQITITNRIDTSSDSGLGRGGEIKLLADGDISLTNGALVDASGNGGGGIEILGDRVSLSDGSGIVSNTTGSELGREVLVNANQLILTDGSVIVVNSRGDGQGGNLTIIASELVQVMGTFTDGEFASSLVTQANRGSTGNAGDLSISTSTLLITNGGQVSSSTFAEGAGGNLTVNASESVQVIGIHSPDGRVRSRLAINTEGIGNNGNLTIRTPRLLIADGAEVGAVTFREGTGGNLSVIATESVQVIGRSTDDKFASILSANTEGVGNGGNLTINTAKLLIVDGGQIIAGAVSEGIGGSLTVNASESVEVIGGSVDGRISSFLDTRTIGQGNAGNLLIRTPTLLIAEGAQVSASTFGEGIGGSLTVNATESVQVIGRSADGRSPSAFAAQAEGGGNAINLSISTPRLLITGGAQVSASTFGEGSGGSLTVNATESVQVIGRSADGEFGSNLSVQANRGSMGKAGDLTIITPRLLIADGAFVSARTLGEGAAGDLTINTKELLITDGAQVSARSEGTAPAGKITLNIGELLSATNGEILTDAEQSAGGAINITAQNIQLFGDSDIRTNVFSGSENGGDINITADSIIVFDDSDILAFARDGAGGDITFNTVAFFGENYRPAPRGTNPVTLDGNNRVDINASGLTNGVVILPDVSFIQNSLNDLPDVLVNPDSLIAGSCIIPTNEPQGSLYITGAGGLPTSPGDISVAPYPTGIVKPIGNSGDSPNSVSRTNRRWQKGDPIIEPTGVYQLPDGRLVMGRECPR